MTFGVPVNIPKFLYFGHEHLYYLYIYIYICVYIIYIYIYITWWFIPVSKWIITPVISELTLLSPVITRVITYLLSGGEPPSLYIHIHASVLVG